MSQTPSLAALEATWDAAAEKLAEALMTNVSLAGEAARDAGAAWEAWRVAEQVKSKNRKEANQWDKRAHK